MVGAVCLMGVSGCGKSTVGEILAKKLGGAYFDGDDFHPPENVEKMREGEPLNDQDRQGWLDRLEKLLRERRETGEWTFLACSALKVKFRDGMREADPDLRFVYLKGDFELIYSRLVKRTEHYMPASLLESQFEALEEPTSEEADIHEVSVEPGPERIAEAIIDWLKD